MKKIIAAILLSLLSFSNLNSCDKEHNLNYLYLPENIKNNNITDLAIFMLEILRNNNSFDDNIINLIIENQNFKALFSEESEHRAIANTILSNYFSIKNKAKVKYLNKIGYDFDRNLLIEEIQKATQGSFCCVIL